VNGSRGGEIDRATSLASTIASACERSLVGGSKAARDSVDRFVLGEVVSLGGTGVEELLDRLVTSESVDVRRFAVRCVYRAYWLPDTGAELLIGSLMRDKDAEVATRARAAWEEIRLEMQQVDPQVLIMRGLARIEGSRQA
jgi:hypothetical protein